MDAFGFPDVSADGQAVVHAAAAKMIFRNATFDNGETIEVDGITYTATADGDWIRLVP